MAQKNNKLDVHWCLPGKKRPFAYSTVATQDLIIELSKLHKTIKDVYNNINYDSDGINILDAYIQAGYGDSVASEFFK